MELLRREPSLWEEKRNENSSKITWRFQTGDIREKLKSLY